MLSNLIIVCGHGIWMGGVHKGYSEDEWLIAPFQAGETPTFIEHVKLGFKILAEDSDSALFFSGGPTRKEINISEARSYYNVGLANDFFGFFNEKPLSPQLLPRVHVEERALDSYYNILFSLTQFYKTYRHWPHKLTIISHAFKKPRIVGHHCKAIGYPENRIEYYGIDPPSMRGIGEADAGMVLALNLWDRDPHGMGPELSGKRRSRNQWGADQSIWGGETPENSGLILGRSQDGIEVIQDGAPKPWSIIALS